MTALLFSLFAVVGLLGCSSSEPPPVVPTPPPVQPTSPSAAPVTAPPVTTVKPEPTPLDPKPVQPEKSNDAPLKAIVARLANKGVSGWEIDPKASAELEKLGKAAEEKLLPLLSDSSADVRRGAAYFLMGRLDPDQEQIATAFIKLLGDEDRAVRGIALTAIGKLRPSQRLAAAPQLLNVLGDPKQDEQQRTTIARLIGDLGEAAAEHAAALSGVAKNDASAKVRAAAILALARIAKPEVTVPVFAESLSDSDPAVRLAAAQRLRALGPAAAPAAKELGSRLGDDSEKLRVAAAEALVRMGSPSLPVFREALDSSSATTRELAVFSLGKMGPIAKPLLPDLQKRLSDSNPKVKELAKLVIQQIELGE